MQKSGDECLEGKKKKKEKEKEILLNLNQFEVCWIDKKLLSPLRFQACMKPAPVLLANAHTKVSFIHRKKETQQDFTHLAFQGLQSLDLSAPQNSNAAFKGIFNSQHDDFVDVLNVNAF